MGHDSKFPGSRGSTSLGRVLGRFLKPCMEQGWYRLMIRLRTRRRVDRSVRILGVPVIVGTRKLTISRRVELHDDLYFETRGQGDIVVGEATVVCRGARFVSQTQIRIGRGVFIGEYALLRDVEDPPKSLERSDEGGQQTAPITIGDDVWIGPGVTVRPGVTIGSGAVVEANAIVTTNIPNGLVVWGIPARPTDSSKLKTYRNGPRR